MAIETLPVWPFEPNWSGTYTEVMEWLTDILTSPKGAEQRRSLRLYPRKTVEFSSVASDNDRQVLRQFLEAHSGRTFYLPQWHESYRSSAMSPAGGDFIPCPDADNGGFRVGDVIFIGASKARRYELAEVLTLSPVGIKLVNPLENEWAPFCKIHPVRKARLDDQPALRKITDRAMSFTAAFLIMEKNNDVALENLSGSPVSFLDIFDGFNVLSDEPDEGEAISYGFTRMIDELDNETSIPRFYDVAGIAFPTQKHNWVSSGRSNYDFLKKLFFALRGRTISLWLPSFTDDMSMVADTPAGENYLTVENFDFTQSGGVRTGYDHLTIFKRDGSKEYRRIVSSTVIDTNVEVIGVDQPFTSGVSTDDVMRISFMRLSRLDQDRIEIVHVTDTQGISKCNATFKAVPNLRIVKDGF
jgi:hypothetical protein